MSDECLFCKILKKEIPAKIVHEDEVCIAFEDLNPQAPVHILLIPRKHIRGLDGAVAEDASALGHLLLTAANIASEKGFAGSGYRTVFNTGAGAGQTVFHIHLHLLGGRSFSWPPG